MQALWIWLGAALVYGLFRLWYDGLRQPLSAAEVERFLVALRGTPGAAVNDEETLRRFLAADDAREFYMLNLVRLASASVPHPETGAATSSGRLLREYIRGFLSVLIRHAGHPALQARKVGGYVDAWNVPPDPGFGIVGLMRYRSRRDLTELCLDPRFLRAHPLKIAAIEATASFPVALGRGLLFGPRAVVALVLALAASLLQGALARGG